MLRPRLLLAAVVAVLVVPSAALAGSRVGSMGEVGPAPEPFGANDAGGFRNILPPGTNGLVNPAQLGAFFGTGTRPAHNDDQLGMYTNLSKVAPHLQARQIPSYFKDATFGVGRGDAASTQSPCPNVTIVRDRGFGVPHIYGSTRAGLMCGIGYATAEDRLFFIDVLRHVGRAQLSSFAGGAPGNQAMDAAQWAVAPYTEGDLRKMVDVGRTLGPEGKQLFSDATNYIAGINRYVSAAKLNPTLMPGEYGALGRPQGPDAFRVTDIAAIASLVGAIFGRGGGNELAWTQLDQSLQGRLGRHGGSGAFLDFRAPDDPEAPTTVHGRRFPYRTLPRKVRPGSVAVPDLGSVRPFVTAKPLGGANGAGGGTPGGRSILRGLGPLQRAAAGRRGLLALPRSQSNALLVSARKSRSGHPIAVFGPQVGYFSPEILMEEDIHGPGIDADGAAFPGTNVYVQLGHGRDYAWSATSAGQDIEDTYALPLCNPRGGRATLDANGYLFAGRCRTIEELDRTNTHTPNAADQTPAGTFTLRAQRTLLGLVIARARIHGRPVIYTRLRATYRHELDSSLGFAAYNDPRRMATPGAFMRAAHKIGYTFNWFYVNRRHIAYYNSGANPVRPSGLNPLLPVWGRKAFLWRGFDPATARQAETPLAAHPHVVDQDYLTSWNNKQAPGYVAPDTDSPFTSIFRSQLLDARVQHGLRRGRRMTAAGMINAMEDAGTADLRGDRVLPWALRVIGRPRSAPARRAVGLLRAWQRTGAHRIDRDANGAYDQSAAVRIMDAWWPKLSAAAFAPALGRKVYAQLSGVDTMDNVPENGGDHLGSAWDVGWYGTVQKDLRAVLGTGVRGRLSRIYCGAGSAAPRGERGRRAALARCRARLTDSLVAAAAEPRTAVYPSDARCKAGDQTCWDSIAFRALGAISQPLIPWINRPTFQQVVEIGARPAR